MRRAAVTGLVGIASGFAGVAVYGALHLIQVVAFGFPWHTGGEAADNPSPVGRFIALSVAGVVAGPAWWALRRWGASTVSVARAVGGTRMPGFSTLANAAVQIVSVGLGASIGKEVAPREIGGWLAQRLSARAGLSASETRVLVACGAAAGLAAVYDVPFGGALFAVEVLLGEISFQTALPAFATSATAALVARIVVPVDTLYAAPHMTMSTSLLVWSIVAGPPIGFAAVGFASLTRRVAVRAPRGPRLLVLLPLTFAAVGLLSIVLPQILGNGRALALAAMNAQLPGSAVGVMAVLALAKAGTTAASIGSGAVGGTMTPSIAIGAAIGSALGGIWLVLWPGAGLAPFAFVGAAAFLAATMRAPFTAVVLVTEFTGQGAEILIPALLAVSGSVAVGYLIGRVRLVGFD